MPEEERSRGVIRYEAIVATLVGICALAVSGYTAYVQRQQVRAAVWPILEYSTSNDPDIRFTLDNKGVGPAIIRHVKVTVDAKPVRNWSQAMQALLGPGPHAFSESDMSGHVLAAGESLTILLPHNPDGGRLSGNQATPLATALDQGRNRIGLEICYSSTLGECWTLRSDGQGSSTVPTKSCPAPSEVTFEH